MRVPESVPSTDAFGVLGSIRTLRKADANYEYSPLNSDAAISRLLRWALQAAAREILQTKPLNGCCRKAIEGQISVVKSKVGNFAYNGLMTCGSVWVCPICASKITELRRKDLQRGMDNWIAAGHGVLLLTLTVPHYAKDKCKDVMNGLGDALRRLFNRVKWKGPGGVAERIGYVGRVRALEVMHGHKDWLRPGEKAPPGGFNGWHPHFHLLIFTETDIFKSSEHEEPREQFMYRERQTKLLEAEILLQWQSCCVAAGLGKPNEKGVELKDGAHAARYVSKWGVDHEMTKGHLKKSSSNGHISPFGLLGLYLDGEKKAGKYFREYAEAFFGRKQLHWGRGDLRARCGLDIELSDEEIAAQKDQESSLFAVIPPSTWNFVLAKEQRGQLLQVCRAGERALEEFLLGLLDKDEGAIQEHMEYMAEYALREYQTENPSPESVELRAFMAECEQSTVTGKIEFEDAFAWKKYTDYEHLDNMLDKRERERQYAQDLKDREEIESMRAAKKEKAKLAREEREAKRAVAQAKREKRLALEVNHTLELPF